MRDIFWRESGCFAYGFNRIQNNDADKDAIQVLQMKPADVLIAERYTQIINKENDLDMWISNKITWITFLVWICKICVTLLRNF